MRNFVQGSMFKVQRWRLLVALLQRLRLRGREEEG
jgi:hypothetical protein